MTLPIYDLVSSCCHRHTDASAGGENTKRILSGTFLAIDALVWISTLAIGILGLVGIVSMSPAASYALIGIASGLTASYLIMFIKNLCQSCQKDDGIVR